MFVKEIIHFAKERYETYKIFLMNLIKQKIDVQKYEDFTRSIFGKKAFLFFTIDKILSSVKRNQKISNFQSAQNLYQ